MKPEFMEVYICPGGIWQCAKCDKALWFTGRIGHHWDSTLELDKCEQHGMSIETFPVCCPPEEQT